MREQWCLCLLQLTENYARQCQLLYQYQACKAHPSREVEMLTSTSFPHQDPPYYGDHPSEGKGESLLPSPGWGSFMCMVY